MDVIGPDWLQGGALFLVALILFFAYRWVRDQMARDEERQEKQIAFMEDMIQQANNERDEQVKAWKGMVQSDIETREQCNVAISKMIEGLDEVNTTLQRTCELQESRHAEVIALLKE